MMNNYRFLSKMLDDIFLEMASRVTLQLKGAPKPIVLLTKFFGSVWDFTNLAWGHVLKPRRHFHCITPSLCTAKML